MASKQRPPRNAKERQLLAEWEATVLLHSKPLERGAIAKGTSVDITQALMRKSPLPTMTSGTRADSDLYKFGSVETPGGGVAGKRASPVYTGSKMLGTAGLHKSNEIPVFSKEEIIDISKMRRN